MSQDTYATRADLYKFGLPRGLLANPGRLCASALAATDAFELDDHGFADGDALILRAESGGNLPAPLVAGVVYIAIRISEASFKVSAAGGTPIDLTTDGVSVAVATPLPIDEVLEFYSRFVDGFLPAHLVPLETPPITVTALVAELSAKKLLLMAGQSSQSMTEFEVAAKAQLERWASAHPLRDAQATPSANLAYSENVATDPRGWGTGGTLT